jgi:hypothetical protein
MQDSFLSPEYDMTANKPATWCAQCNDWADHRSEC